MEKYEAPTAEVVKIRTDVICDSETTNAKGSGLFDEDDLFGNE